MLGGVSVMTHRMMAIVTLATVGFSTAARASIVFSQVQTHVGGGTSDTEFLYFGNQVWERSADDFVLSAPATINGVTWWGFFGNFYDLNPEPPPLAQTVRMSVYEPRPTDGLPGNLLYQELVVDPSRTATGFTVSEGAGLPEFRYDVTLANPWLLDSSQRYWLEITQMDDLPSTFRWNYSNGNGTPYALISPLTANNWRYISSGANLAFQLTQIPEPAFALPLVGSFYVLVRWTKC